MRTSYMLTDESADEHCVHLWSVDACRPAVVVCRYNIYIYIYIYQSASGSSAAWPQGADGPPREEANDWCRAAWKLCTPARVRARPENAGVETTYTYAAWRPTRKQASRQAGRQASKRANQQAHGGTLLSPQLLVCTWLLLVGDRSRCGPAYLASAPQGPELATAPLHSTPAPATASVAAGVNSSSSSSSWGR
eukprot:GHVU01048095.1.p1 GENE.GHVU01048095.1~~GHVU01048095.1.p1  ORF type:complete len:193 (+),score=17.89 GHVU01048095.1:321-899(+)